MRKLLTAFVLSLVPMHAELADPDIRLHCTISVVRMCKPQPPGGELTCTGWRSIGTASEFVLQRVQDRWYYQNSQRRTALRLVEAKENEYRLVDEPTDQPDVKTLYTIDRTTLKIIQRLSSPEETFDTGGSCEIKTRQF